MHRLLPLAALLMGLISVPAAQAEDCKPGFIDFLPSVRKEAVAAVDESYKIGLRIFCVGEDFHDLGNAAGLTRTIAANPYLSTALDEKGARPDDVRFVRIVENRVTLWVHRN